MIFDGNNGFGSEYSGSGKSDKTEVIESGPARHGRPDNATRFVTADININDQR